jgi:hypothetical protein
MGDPLEKQNIDEKKITDEKQIIDIEEKYLKSEYQDIKKEIEIGAIVSYDEYKPKYEIPNLENNLIDIVKGKKFTDPIKKYYNNVEKLINIRNKKKFVEEINILFNTFRKRYEKKVITKDFVDQFGTLMKMALLLNYHPHYYDLFKTMPHFKHIYEYNEEALKNAIYITNLFNNNPNFYFDYRRQVEDKELETYYRKLISNRYPSLKNVIFDNKNLSNKNSNNKFKYKTLFSKQTPVLFLPPQDSEVLPNLEIKKNNRQKNEWFGRFDNSPKKDNIFYTKENIETYESDNTDKIKEILETYEKLSRDAGYNEFYTDIETRLGGVAANSSRYINKSKVPDIQNLAYELQEEAVKLHKTYISDNNIKGILEETFDADYNKLKQGKCPLESSKKTKECEEDSPLILKDFLINKKNKSFDEHKQRQYMFGLDFGGDKSSGFDLGKKCKNIFITNPWLFSTKNPFIQGLAWSLMYNLLLINCIKNSDLIFPVRFILPERKSRYTSFEEYTDLKFEGNILFGMNDFRKWENKSDKKKKITRKSYIFYLFSKDKNIFIFNERANIVYPGSIFEGIKVYYLELLNLIKNHKMYPYLYIDKGSENEKILFISIFSPEELKTKLENNEILKKIMPVIIKFPSRGGYFRIIKPVIKLLFQYNERNFKRYNTRLNEIYKTSKKNDIEFFSKFETPNNNGNNNGNNYGNNFPLTGGSILYKDLGYTQEIISLQDVISGDYSWDILFSKKQEIYNKNIFPFKEFESLNKRKEYLYNTYGKENILKYEKAVNKYGFIKEKIYSHEIELKNKKDIIKDYINSQKSILKHNFIIDISIYSIEYILKFNLLQDRIIYFGRNPQVLEALLFLKKNVKIDAYVLKYYIDFLKEENYAQEARDKLPITFKNVTTPVNLKYINTFTKKNNLFVADLMIYHQYLHPDVRENMNNQLLLSLLLLMTNVLEDGGDAIFLIPSIKNTLTANIVFLLTKLFENKYLYITEIGFNSFIAFTIIICKNFKSSPEIKENLTQLVEELYKINPAGGIHYNILDKNIRKELDITKEITKNTPQEYLLSFLQISDTFYQQFYDYNLYKIRENNQLLDDIEYYIKYVKDNPDREDEYKLYQLFHSKNYAEKLGLKTKRDFDKEIFSAYFQKELLNSMFLGEQIKFKFNKNKIETDFKFKNFNKEILEIKKAVNSRDKNVLSRLYSIYETILGKRLGINNFKLDWAIFYEIMFVFPQLFPYRKENKVQFKCVNDNIINSIEFYLKQERTSYLTQSDEYDTYIANCDKTTKFRDGSNCVIRMKLLLENKDVNKLKMLYHNFEELYIYKPIQDPDSIYFYVIGINYGIKNNLNNFDKQLDNIIEKLVDNYDRYNEKNNYYIDNIKNIDQEHIKEILNIMVNRIKEGMEEMNIV